jgi:hypothetical protein
MGYSYYQTLKLVEGIGRALGYKTQTKVSIDGALFDVVWKKGKKNYSFRLGFDSKNSEQPGLAAIRAVELGFKHYHIVSSDEQMKQLEALKLITNFIDLRDEQLNDLELLRAVIPSGKVVRHRDLTVGIIKQTGCSRPTALRIIKRNKDKGVLQADKLGYHTIYYRLVGGGTNADVKGVQKDAV